MESFPILESFRNVDLDNSEKDLRSFYSCVINLVCCSNYKELYKCATSFLDDNSKSMYLFGATYIKHLKYGKYDIDYSWLKSTELLINSNPKRIISKKFVIRGAISAFSIGKIKRPKDIHQSNKKGLNSKVIYIAKKS